MYPYELPDQDGQQYVSVDTTSLNVFIEKDALAVVCDPYFAFNAGDVTAGSGTYDIPNN